ncbi:uncharacterized protein IL334_003666 [Kwoniella shivajii]|uniref:Uncharacterized protein n=1 Tax=Kwoniella shivajii TaxID=564305 RepID=A0ABZ1CYI6_9TREE|nr:hypothetical protein IL334_003666 [Kwoniella shivajii]
MDIALTSSPLPIHNDVSIRPLSRQYMTYGQPPPNMIQSQPTFTTGRGRGRGRGRGGAQKQVTQRPVTPPFVYLQRPNGNVNGSPSSNETEPLPPNHIHIVQTNPNPQMNRTNSTFSINSVFPLSNGPSSTEGSSESLHTSPNQISRIKEDVVLAR